MRTSQAGTIKAAVYVRISKDSAGDGLGVERQLEACRHLAKAKGWEIDEDWVLDENDTSASGPRRRPQFERLMRGMESGEVQALLAYRVDRLMRRLDDMVRLWEVAKRRNVIVATVAGDLDLSTPSGRTSAMLFGVVAAIEIENLRDRLEDKALQSVNAGRNANGGTRPFGWQKTRKKQNAREAEVIRDVAARLIGGESLTSVCRSLNRAGVSTVGGRRWDVRKLRDVLNNERHAGRVEHRGKVVTDEHGQPVEAKWEPILDPETFDRLQAALLARRVVSDRWTGDRRHLLSGKFLRCSVCGEKLLPFGQTTGRVTYRCRGHLARDRDRTDAHVLRLVREYALANPIKVTSWETEERADLSEQIATLEQRLADMEDQFVTAGGDAARFGRVSSALDAQLAALRAERLDRLAMETGVEWAQFDMTTLLGQSGSLLPQDTDQEKQAKADFIEEQRNAIRLYVDKIVIAPTARRGRFFDADSIEIHWRDVNRLRWSGVVEA
ncbi:MAG: recombinase family protein [Dermatophilaceae bacterium]